MVKHKFAKHGVTVEYKIEKNSLQFTRNYSKSK